ncbi:hypothetical protein AAMO2058_000833900 [Amorphochlora amoebiformis]|mmetsp:Transcript_34580/g.55742  ORF Transcript_34580/g.55742 Transcript_34580/m.55742 type:complete len:364 (-) Transcript_34580:212-1303(-)
MTATTRMNLGAKASSSAVIPCLAYSSCSIMMVLLNKTLAKKAGKIPLSVVMFIQNLTTLLLVHLFDICLSDKAKSEWRIKLPKFRAKTCLLWLPVNVIFLLMLFSGFKTLQLVTVSFVSICKNVTNVFTTTGDYMLFGEPISFNVIIALFLMIIAAFMGASDEFTDTTGAINIPAAAWMTINCMSTSAYGLQIKMSQKRTKLSPYGCTYYNALVATPLTLIWTIGTGDLFKFAASQDWYEPVYLASLVLSSIIGFGIGFSVFWCISATSPTTYAMVGATNKIPLAVLGIVLFGDPLTKRRVSFIILGILAGMIYAHAKAKLKMMKLIETQKKESKNGDPSSKVSLEEISLKFPGDNNSNHRDD